MTKCINHKPRQISYEAIYKDRFQFGEPVEYIYIFKCLTCGESHAIKCKK